jgi:hypothetical protein
MNILESLYEACIMRMCAFVEDEDRTNTENKKNFSHKYKFFREVLENIQSPQHPNLPYFIYKSIILNNLYGVDVMKEAIEIAKLRLFLKLVATVDADYRKPNLGLEPLPDIDFNIRSGNTLVGFATLNEAVQAINAKDKTGQMGLVFDDELDIVNTVKNKADDLAVVFKSFKRAQLDDDLSEFKQAKDKLQTYKANLNNILNEYLAFNYGIDIVKQPDKYQQWLATHQSFHWFAEFYEIINGNGGFDVIIGNPPYVEYSKVKRQYKINNYQTESCGNLYAFVMERSKNIITKVGKTGFIVPMSIGCTERMQHIQKIIKKSNILYISNFSDSPGLFDGVDRTISILIYDNGEKSKIFTTNFNKWKSEQRDQLVDNLNYGLIESKYLTTSIIPKIKTSIEKNILDKIAINKKNISQYFNRNSLNKIYYKTTGGRHYKIFTDFPPEFYLDGNRTNSSRETHISLDDNNLNAILSVLFSNLYMWFYYIHSNCRDNNPSDVGRLKIDLNNTEKNALSKLSKLLMIDLIKNSSLEKSNNGKGQTQTFHPALSKPIIDEIDTILAEHYGFTEEELDFIINYDIKYRMGKELGEEDE